MTMDKHLFEGAGRVRADALASVTVKRWMPPEIDARGKLIPVEPREDSVREQLTESVERAVSTAQSAAPVAADSVDVDAEVAAAREEGFAEGRQKGLEEGRIAGHEEGFSNGHSEGLAKGLAEGREQIAEQLRQINRLATSLTHALNQQDYQLEQAMMNLVREVARQVIDRELMMDNAVIMKLVRKALDALPPSRDNVRILVNPDDLPVLEQAINEGGENWRAYGRKDISRGGCRIETDQSVVDYTTDYRFRRLMEQVMAREMADPSVAQEALEPAPEPVVVPVSREITQD